jgi:hypothetical protein
VPNIDHNLAALLTPAERGVLESLYNERRLLETQLEGIGTRITRLEARPLRDAVQGVFETFPQVEAFTWTQCPPWRDGEETSFEVDRDRFSVVIDDEEHYVSLVWESGSGNAVAVAAADLFGRALARFDDGQLERWFGSTSQVTVTREGYTIKHYEDG